MKKVSFFLFLLLTSFNAYSIDYATPEEAWAQCILDHPTGFNTCTEYVPAGVCNVKGIVWWRPEGSGQCSGGGTFYYVTSDCVGGEFDPITGLCPVPVDCTAGQEIELGIEISHFNNQTTSTHAGCAYEMQVDISRCFTGPSGKRICPAVAVTTGELAETVVDANQPNLTLLPDPVPPSNEGCLQGNKDGLPAEYCIKNYELGEGTINDVPITVNSSTPSSCILVKGVEICAGGQKSCGFVQQEYMCVTESLGANLPNSLPKNCFTKKDGSTGCIEGQSEVKTDTQTSVVTNEDGSTTTTTTEVSNVINIDDHTTTTTNNTDGTTTTITDGANPDGTSREVASAVGEGNDILKQIQEGQVTGNDILNQILGAPEDYDSTTFGSQLADEAQSNTDSLISDFQGFVSDNPFESLADTDISSWLPTLPSSTCSGGINTTIFGRAFVLEPCEKLEPLRDILAWVFSIFAALSVIRTVFSINSVEGQFVMGALFTGLLNAISASFAVWIGTSIRRAPLTVAFFSASVVIIGTYLTAMKTLVAGIEIAVPAVAIEVWGWFMPSNVGLILSAIYGAKIAKWVHYKVISALNFKIKQLSK